MQTIIRLSGKAEQVFKYLDLLIQRYGNITLAQLRGGDTLQRIIKEGKQNDRRKGTS